MPYPISHTFEQSAEGLVPSAVIDALENRAREQGFVVERKGPQRLIVRNTMIGKDEGDYNGLAGVTTLDAYAYEGPRGTVVRYHGSFGESVILGAAFPTIVLVMAAVMARAVRPAMLVSAGVLPLFLWLLLYLVGMLHTRVWGRTAVEYAQTHR